MEQNGDRVTVTDQFSGNKVEAEDAVKMDNGVYYVMGKMVQPTFHSLMEELGAHPEYSEFVELLEGNPEWNTAEENLYALLSTTTSMDNTTIETFSSYHYTVYVPDNDAMEKGLCYELTALGRYQ